MLNHACSTGLIDGLLHLTQRHRNYVYFSTLIILIVSIIGMLKIVPTGNLTGDLPESDSIKKDLKFVEEKFGGSIPFEVMINYPDGNWWKKETLHKVEKVQNCLNQ